MKLDQDQQTQLLALKGVAVDQFTQGNWTELGMLTGCLDDVRRHQRLLRSLSFGDDDYPDHAPDMLLLMAVRESGNIARMENYVLSVSGGAALPAMDGGKRVFFKPSQADVPFDLQHHRYLQYLPNREGLEDLTEQLAKRLQTLSGKSIGFQF